MKPNGSEVKFQSTMQGQEVRLHVKEANMAHILGVLTDMYSDKQTAVLREYATNGYDAQIEAGVQRPLEVTIPTGRFDIPAVKIRDFGVGLSATDIQEIYASYGESTKRDSNAYNGMLGIGAKAALTYTSQFTVTSIKDGVKIQVAVTRDAQGGSMRILSTEPTTEPSGTEVTVPLKPNDAYGFIEKAKALYRFWPKGSVNVNGQSVQHWLDEVGEQNVLKLSDDFYVVPCYVTGGKHRIVMGNVPYPIELPDLPLNTFDQALLAFVPIGTVDFQPSREMLMETETTDKALVKLTQDFSDAARAAVQKEIDAAASGREAIKVAMRWRNSFPNLKFDYTYKGTEIPAHIQVAPKKVIPAHKAKRVDGTEYDVPEQTVQTKFILVGRSSYKLSDHSKVSAVEIDRLSDAVWVHSYDSDNWTAPKKRKLQQWCYDTGNQGQYFIFAPGAPDDAIKQWMDPANIVDWSAIRDTKVTTHGARVYGGKALPGSYEVYHNGQHVDEMLAADIQKVKDVFYVRGNANRTYPYVSLVTKYHPDNVIVCLPENRLAKFRRDFPNARTAQEHIKQLFEDWKKGVTKDQLTALAMQNEYGAEYCFTTIDASRVDDPEIKRACRLVKVDVKTLKKERQVFESLLGRGVLDAGQWTNPMDDYPLFESYAIRRNPDHVYCYLNAAYKTLVKPARDKKGV